MNRGVEIDPSVADDQDALIVTQVARRVSSSGWRFSTTCSRTGRCSSKRWRSSRSASRVLYAKTAPRDSLVVTGARVLDPVEGVDATVDVRVDDGVISAIGTSLERNEHRVVDGTGLVLAPAFVDPHVHLRTPGREDEETIASGTAAALPAATARSSRCRTPSGRRFGGGARLARRAGACRRCDPRRLSRGDHEGPAGSGADGDGRARRRRRCRFTDDGRPFDSPALMRRALQYASSTDRPSRCTGEPSLSRDGQMHEGEVSAELGVHGLPSVAESLMVGRDLALAAYEDQPLHLCTFPPGSPLSCSPARARRAARDGRGHSSSSCLTDEAVRTLDPNLKMNPPLRGADDRAALIEGLRNGTITCVATTTRRTRATRKRCRSRRPRSASPASRRRSPRSTRTSSSRGC